MAGIREAIKRLEQQMEDLKRLVGEKPAKAAPSKAPAKDKK